MQLDILNIKVQKEQDIETLRNTAFLLIKCLQSDKSGRGYCVVIDQNPHITLYEGGRENCISFVKGLNVADAFDGKSLCICVDTPSRMIVIPEDRFGEKLSVENSF